MPGEFRERGDKLPAQPLRAFGDVLVFRQFERLKPRPTFPAELQGQVFERVQLVILDGKEACLQHAEPIVVSPAKRDRAQRVTREFRQRVVRDPLAAVKEERNFVAREDTTECVVIAVERAHDDRTIAEPAAGANVTKDFSSSDDGFGLCVGTGDQADAGCQIGIACCGLTEWFWL